MALPLRVKNALRLGHPLAAEIPSQMPNGRAWVYIQPKMKSGKTYHQVKNEWTHLREVDRAYDDEIAAYIVRLLELSSWEEDLKYDDWFDKIAHRKIRDQRADFSDTTRLEEWMQKYLQDLNRLREPMMVGYYFDLRY